MKTLSYNRKVELRRRIDGFLDSGAGACQLRDERIALLVREALLHFDKTRYVLLAWVIMPNHVHVLIECIGEHTLPALVHSWKSFTAKRANEILGTGGRFWHREYHDRYVRNEEHLQAARDYIHDNPVKAGLVGRAGDWMWSSAWNGGR